MTAKEFLRRAREVDRRVDEAQERVERLRARLEAGRMSRITGMPRGGSGDWTQTADRLIELEQRVNEQTRELVRWKLAAMDAIEQVEEMRRNQPHELGPWVTVIPATCANEGLQQAVCQVCGAVEEYVLKMHICTW